MPFCPECGYEYVEGTTYCPDCQCNLVDELPKHKQEDDIELVALHSLPGIVYAEMVKEALAREGIKSVIQTDNLSSGLLIKGLDAAGGACKILVDKRYQKKAASILNTMMDHI